MGFMREWWRENKAKNKALDKQLRSTFDLMKLQNESFTEYKRRMIDEQKQEDLLKKKKNRNKPF